MKKGIIISLIIVVLNLIIANTVPIEKITVLSTINSWKNAFFCTEIHIGILHLLSNLAYIIALSWILEKFDRNIKLNFTELLIFIFLVAIISIKVEAHILFLKKYYDYKVFGISGGVYGLMYYILTMSIYSNNRDDQIFILTTLAANFFITSLSLKNYAFRSHLFGSEIGILYAGFKIIFIEKLKKTV